MTNIYRFAVSSVRFFCSFWRERDRETETETEREERETGRDRERESLDKVRL